jgi:hypothetical protein
MAENRYITGVMSVWKTRHSGILERYSAESLRRFISLVYSRLSHFEKEAVTKYIRDYLVDIENFNSTSLEKAIQHLQVERSDNAIKSSYFRSDAWIQKTSEEQAATLKAKSIKANNTRAEKFKGAGIGAEKALKLSYQNAIVNKGRKIAEMLGLDSALFSTKELSLLSGQTKRKSFSTKTIEKNSELTNNGSELICFISTLAIY